MTGCYVNRLMNSKSTKEVSTKQPTRMIGGRRGPGE